MWNLSGHNVIAELRVKGWVSISMPSDSKSCPEILALPRPEFPGAFGMGKQYLRHQQCARLHAMLRPLNRQGEPEAVANLTGRTPERDISCIASFMICYTGMAG